MSNSIYVHKLASDQITVAGLNVWDTVLCKFEFDATIVKNPAPTGVIKLSRFANIGFITIRWPAKVTSNSNDSLLTLSTNPFTDNNKFMPAAPSQVLGNIVININDESSYAQLLLITDTDTMNLQILLESGASIDEGETFMVGTIGNPFDPAISNFTYSIDLTGDTAPVIPEA